MPRIVFTGGGTAGHVLPAMPVLQSLQGRGWRVSWIGSRAGIERRLCAEYGVSDYRAVSTGKLRRYRSLQNLVDALRVPVGVLQALWWLLRLRPRLVFSKGGYVAVPVIAAAWLLRIPVIAHESDLTPGLATRLSMRFATTLCCGFPELPTAGTGRLRIVHTGTPVRAALLAGDRARGRRFLGLAAGEARAVLLVMGGSMGAVRLNDAVRQALPALTRRFDVVHLCGAGRLEPALDGRAGYRQYEFIGAALADVFAASDLVVSRAGANALCELLELRLPHLLVPLSRAASRGDQIENAAWSAARGYSRVIEESTLTGPTLLEALDGLEAAADDCRVAMAQWPRQQALAAVLAEIDRLVQSVDAPRGGGGVGHSRLRR